MTPITSDSNQAAQLAVVAWLESLTRFESRFLATRVTFLQN